MEGYDAIVMGIGEIGRPLYELLNGVYEILPLDPIHYPDNEVAPCNFLHVCIPGELKTFKEAIKKVYLWSSPKYIIIHSTVVPGTIDKMQTEFACPIIHAPVHGKHQNNQMKKDMLKYPKYLGMPYSITAKESAELVEHFAKAGFATIIPVAGVKNTEWAKVLSTTIFGLQVAFAQEVERICDKFALDYDTVTHFFPIQEDARGPIYPGFIGGHCVMPNVKLIKEVHKSKLLDWMEWSNEKKKKRDDINMDDRGR